MSVTIEPKRTGKPCLYCTDLTTHDVSGFLVCDLHIRRATNSVKNMQRGLGGPLHAPDGR